MVLLLHMQWQTKTETIRNYMLQAILIGEPQILHTFNGKNLLRNFIWFEKWKNQAYIRRKYHPQCQEVVESFIKIIQRFMIEAYTKSMFNGDEEWSLLLMVSYFLHYNDNKRVYST